MKPTDANAACREDMDRTIINSPYSDAVCRIECIGRRLLEKVRLHFFGLLSPQEGPQSKLEGNVGSARASCPCRPSFDPSNFAYAFATTRT